MHPAARYGAAALAAAPWLLAGGWGYVVAVFLLLALATPVGPWALLGAGLATPLAPRIPLPGGEWVGAAAFVLALAASLGPAPRAGLLTWTKTLLVLALLGFLTWGLHVWRPTASMAQGETGEMALIALLGALAASLILAMTTPEATPAE